MKGNSERRCPLSTKLLMVQLGSLCLALTIFLAGLYGGRWLLENVYLQPEAMHRRELDYIRDLRAYVEENGLASTDSQALAHWAREQKYVYLSIYRGEQPVLETDGYDTELPDREALSNDLAAAGETMSTYLLPDEEGYYTMEFQDGVFRVGVVEYSETPLYDLVVILSLAAACLTMVIINMHSNHRLSRAIVALSREVQYVETGSRDTIIQSERGDELGDLARAVERMRRAVIQQTQNEQDAWQANSGLITAISHDIRTPLTALMGYLDLLDGEQYRDEDQMRRYLAASREKARQLKDLTDELCRYFLVYTNKEVELHPESYDAVILMEQLLEEQAILLREQGFQVRVVPLQEPATLRVDVQYLQRVLDNLFSNVQKHADRARPVTLMARKDGDLLRLDVVNGIPPRPNPAESTRIGLQTCRKIVQQMGGVFEIQEEERKFLVEITLPLEKPAPEGAAS